jgi:hypothetical protein
MIYMLSTTARDAVCDQCAQSSSTLAAASFDAAAGALRVAQWHVTVSGRTYCPTCASSAAPRQRGDDTHGGP